MRRRSIHRDNRLRMDCPSYNGGYSLSTKVLMILFTLKTWSFFFVLSPFSADAFPQRSRCSFATPSSMTSSTSATFLQPKRRQRLPVHLQSTTSPEDLNDILSNMGLTPASVAATELEITKTPLPKMKKNHVGAHRFLYFHLSTINIKQSQVYHGSIIYHMARRPSHDIPCLCRISSTLSLASFSYESKSKTLRTTPPRPSFGNFSRCLTMLTTSRVE